MLAPNSLLQNRYLIVRSIGQGGMGTVYLARDQRLGNTVALKETFFTDARMRRAFEREARLLAHLRHPALPKVIDHFDEEDGQFLVMEYIPGDDLEVLLAQRGQPFPLEKVLRWADQLLDALEYLHTQEEHPILHRDIKPANLKLTGRSQNQIILLDFGLAKGSIGQMTSVAQSKSVVGFTPNFAPLEQIQGTGTDPRSDLYSLGATLYYLLTGVIPPNALERATAVISRRPDPLVHAAELPFEIPPAIAEVLKNAMSQSPDDRYATAEAMRIAMQDAARVSAPASISEAKTIVSPKLPAQDSQQREESPSSWPETISYSPPHEVVPPPLPIVPTRPSDPRIYPSGGEMRPPEQSPWPNQSAPHAAASSSPVSDSSPAIQTIAARYEPAVPSFSTPVSESTPRPRKRERFLLFGGLALLLVAAIGFAIYKLVGSNQSQGETPIGKVTKLTNTSKASNPIISRDGKFIIYEIKESEQKRSLWRKNMDGGSDVQLLPPTRTGFGGFNRITLTQDGSSIFYSLDEYSEQGGSKNVLYQISSSGGSPRRLANDIGYTLSISAEGRQVAFIRTDYKGPDQQESSLIVANVDGTGEKKLDTIKSPERFGYNIEWSPDGKQLAYTRTSNSKKDDEREGDSTLIVVNADGTGEKSVVTHKKREGFGPPVWSPDGKLIARISYPEYEEGYADIAVVQISDGTEKKIGSQQWMYMDNVTWLADGKGLIFAGVKEDSDKVNIWQLSYPGGETQVLTGGLDNIWGISVSDDGKIVTTSSDSSSTLWVGSSRDGKDARQIASGQFYGLSWSPDGRILYTSKSNGNPDIWIMNSDGSGQKQLTTDPKSDFGPVMTPDGRYIVFTSTRAGKSNIWRMNSDGSNPKQLTSGNREADLSCTPDSRWIVYTSVVSGKRKLFKISIDGGNPIQLADDVRSPQVSPDGKYIACYYREDEKTTNFVLLPIEGGAPTKTIKDVYGFNFKWMPDGSGVTYLDQYASGGKEITSHSSIDFQPLDGGQRTELTKFPDAKGDDPFYPIGDHAWARDGRLAFTRLSYSSDLIMISDFK
ncbi:MAG TPA: protein kinase [Pyrinomonadaceae bacterium]